jgi:ubiquinone biosynthesis protein COQ9
MTEPTLQDRAVAAALDLAATRPWSDVALADVAGAAGSDLAAFDAAGIDAEALLARIEAHFDAAMLAGVTGVDRSERARDRLFEALMRRFDAMEPRRAAILSMRAGQAGDPALTLFAMRARMRTANRTLRAAGLDPSGLAGRLRAAGLSRVIGKTDASWREDGPDLSRTMATLDQALSDAEGAARRINGLFRNRSADAGA